MRTPLRIHLRDNPPLFAWVEYENYHFTGDTAQANLVVHTKRYLQRHYDYFGSVPKGDLNTALSPDYNPIRHGVERDSLGRPVGFTWTGGASGMDNTPRGLRRLRFGDVEADFIYNARRRRIETRSNRPFTLVANGRRIAIEAGRHHYRLKAPLLP